MDTSMTVATLAVRDAGGKISQAPPDFAQRHARGLIPAVRSLFETAGFNVRNLAAIGVGLGPGSFTGLRVGVTAAKVLAYASGCPLVALDTFEAIAMGASDSSGAIVVAADAQRGEVFRGRFIRSDEGLVHRLGPTEIVTLAQLRDELEPGEVIAGQVLEKDGRAMDFRQGVVLAPAGRCAPSARSLLTLTDRGLLEGRLSDLAQLEPVYIRRSAAEEKAARTPLAYPSSRGSP
jgi:tRNA threonylcarbamoyladenosine biosynthesis protein TsaB